jgi:hypothetical protein
VDARFPGLELARLGRRFLGLAPLARIDLGLLAGGGRALLLLVENRAAPRPARSTAPPAREAPS